MPRVTSRLSVLCATLLVASSAFTTVPPVSTVGAADAPWTLPTVPVKCTTAQANSGDVAGCIIASAVGLPESRGWPTPPFPDAGTGTTTPWVDVARGASGATVTRIQQALIANGASIVADGQFGPATETAVRNFQTAHALAVTGIVDAATATALGLVNTTVPVFPPAGWNWLGWAYNGSPILQAWESQLVANATQIGTVRPGTVKAFPDALPLFEGFLAEIQARGYVVRDEGTYAFRCTASTTKDCHGLTRAALSNHAYGLASDFNTAQNPMKTYYGVGGKSACQTPIITDIPQWVVGVAQKWGLYWGGFGWSAGCTSPAQVKSSASRDPMHFEFNGTVAQAKAILAHNASGACFDVVDIAGVISHRCYGAAEVPGAGTRVVVTTGAPAGATAALVNITATAASTTGYFTAEGCGAAPDVVRASSNGNVRPGRAVAAAAIVQLDAQGRFCLYQSTAMHTIVDVQGFFSPAASAPNGNLFVPVTPQRSTDTRTEPYCTPGGQCQPGPIAAGAEVVNTADAPANAVATVANITARTPSTGGYVTADACSTLTPGPQTRSNVNFAAGDTVANLGVVPSQPTANGSQFCTYSPSGLHEIIDVQGFFVPAATAATWTNVSSGASGATVTAIQQALNQRGAGLIADGQFGPLTLTAVKAFQTSVGLSATGIVDTATATALGLFSPPTGPQGLAYTTLAPSRLVDTRQCWTDAATSLQRCGQLNDAGSVIHMRAPTGASVVVVNLTALSAASGGYVSAGACSTFTGAAPGQSNLNAVPGAAVANLAVVPVDADGTFCAYVSAPMHLLVDLIGSYSAAGTLRFLPVTPVRVHDSRP